MVKKTFACGLSALFLLLSYAVPAFSTETGPEELILKSSTSDTQPPAVFPHKLHQATLACGECHHGMADGKQVPYAEGTEIQKCESCHNSDVLGGRKAGKLDLDEFKGAAHANCQECHKKVAKEDSAKKNLKSCKTCHQK